MLHDIGDISLDRFVVQPFHPDMIEQHGEKVIYAAEHKTTSYSYQQVGHRRVIKGHNHKRNDEDDGLTGVFLA